MTAHPSIKKGYHELVLESGKVKVKIDNKTIKTFSMKEFEDIGSLQQKVDYLVKELYPGYYESDEYKDMKKNDLNNLTSKLNDSRN